MKQHVTFCVVFLCLCDLISCNQQHLVCKTMNDIFTDHDGTESSSRGRRLQGPAGKRGPPGIRGSPGVPGNIGPPGAPAIIDYDRINDVINEKVASATAEMNSRITELERNLTEQQQKNAQVACEVTGGLYYGQGCYTFHLSSSINYDKAVAVCAKTGSLLAEIHDRAHQIALNEFGFAKLASGQSSANIWVGMEYQTSTGTLRYKSRKVISRSQFTWHPGYPQSNNKYMLIQLRPPGHQNFGFFNKNSASYTNTHGVLCEKPN